MNDRSALDLDPSLQPTAQAFLDRVNAAIAPSKCILIVTWRDAADQNAAKCEGLSKAGAGQSPHDCVDANGNPASRAFDFGILDAQGNYVSDGMDVRYQTAGSIALSFKDEAGNQILEWGGSWRLATDGCNPDFDHIELANWRGLSQLPTT